MEAQVEELGPLGQMMRSSGLETEIAPRCLCRTRTWPRHPQGSQCSQSYANFERFKLQVLNTIPFGVGVATSSRIGNLLGARNAKGAALSANVAAWLSMILGGLVLAILMITKDSFARLFNDDDQVVKLTARVLPYVALFQIADGLNGSCGGALRGMGRQHVGALVNIVSYYCGALPLGIYLAFHEWGLAGLWVGQCIALYIVGLLEWLIVAFSNWEKQVSNAFKRMDAGDRAELGENTES